MTTYLLTGVVLFGSFFISSLLLQRLADLISLRLWQTVPQPELRSTAAEIDHVIAAIVTAAVFGLQWRDHPKIAVSTALFLYLLLLFSGIARLLLLTRRQMLRIEEHQFSLEGDQIRLHESDHSPELIICHLAEQKYPSLDDPHLAFSSAAIELYSPQLGLVARNIYYDRLQATRMIEQLQQGGQARCFDLALIGQEPNGNFLSLRLGNSWVPLLCGPLRELPPQIRKWWKELLMVDGRQARELKDTSFGLYLRPLYLAAVGENLLRPEFEHEFTGLEQLLKRTKNQLQLINGKQLHNLIPTGFTPASETESALFIWRMQHRETDAAS